MISCNLELKDFFCVCNLTIFELPNKIGNSESLWNEVSPQLTWEAEIILNLFSAWVSKLRRRRLAELGGLDRLREMTDYFPFEEKASQEENSLQFEAKKLLKL